MGVTKQTKDDAYELAYTVPVDCYEGYVFLFNCVDGQYHAETIGDVIGLVNREEDAP